VISKCRAYTVGVDGGSPCSCIDVLPSVSARIRLDSHDNSAFRLAYARGLSRPNPTFLTTATSVDNSTAPPTLTIGNPALKLEHANNYDVLYERYLRPLGAIQAGFSYKSISTPNALGYTAAEQEGLIRQARRIAPITKRLFSRGRDRAWPARPRLGFWRGRRCMLVTRLVGPTGEVVGIERDASSIARAKDRVVKAGLRNLSFRQTDVNQVVSDRLFDAAVGRFILMFLPDPVSVLHSVSRLVRPGGVVAFQEPSWTPMLALGRACHSGPKFFLRFMKRSCPPGSIWRWGSISMRHFSRRNCLPQRCV
jgi:SAM-dependent methyltransferase